MSLNQIFVKRVKLTGQLGFGDFVCDDSPIRGRDYSECETGFEIGLVETGHELVAVRGFELSVEVLVVVLRISERMQTSSVILVESFELNLHFVTNLIQ
jgi:hypothetical protein